MRCYRRDMDSRYVHFPLCIAFLYLVTQTIKEIHFQNITHGAELHIAIDQHIMTV